MYIYIYIYRCVCIQSPSSRTLHGQCVVLLERRVWDLILVSDCMCVQVFTGVRGCRPVLDSKILRTPDLWPVHGCGGSHNGRHGRCEEA